MRDEKRGYDCQRNRKQMNRPPASIAYPDRKSTNTTMQSPAANDYHNINKIMSLYLAQEGEDNKKA